MRDIAPESLVWKERGSGRFSMLDRAQKDADAVGRFKRRRAAIVCGVLAENRYLGDKAYTRPMYVSNVTPVHGISFQYI